MSEPMIIVGAGGQGRETAFVHLLTASEGQFIGFLDDRQSGATPEGWPIVGRIDDAPRYRKAMFLMAINDPRTRRGAVRRIAAAGVDRWGSVRHPEVRLHDSVRIGLGCSILGGCQLTTSIRVGDHSIINRCSQVGHDCVIGSYCSINPGACLSGAVVLGDGCEIGSGSTVRQGTKIASGSTVGMGAAVAADVAEDSVVVGVPARPLRSNMPW